MLKKLAFAMVAMICTCAILTSCGQGAANKLESIKKNGKMVVYTNPEFPPYEYVGDNGKIVGAEIDLVERIAAKLGVKAEFVSAEFDSILGTVQTGKADMGASGFTINEERKKQVDFTIPFVKSVQFIILPAASTIKFAEDLAGKKIGGQQGTTGFIMVEDAVNKGILKDTKAEVKAYNNAPDALTAMKEGKLDAVVIDELVAISLANSAPGYKAIELVKKDGKGLDAPEEFGLMIAKGNEDLVKICNEVIEEMIKDGSLKKSIQDHNVKATLLQSKSKE